MSRISPEFLLYQATSSQVRGKKGGQDGEVQRKEADTSTREEDPNEKDIEDPSQLSEGQSFHEHRVSFSSSVYCSGYINSLYIGSPM